MLNTWFVCLLLTITYTLNAPVSTFGTEKFKGPHSTEKNIHTPLSEESIQRIVSLHSGDVFRGRAKLAKLVHNPAELTLYIKNMTSRDVNNSEFEIEAIAVMNISNIYSVYGLQGIYVPEWEQLELYEVRTIQTTGIAQSGGTLINTEFFEPVGLAGRITEDNQKIYCHIAYNGNASLVRLQDNTVAFNFPHFDQLSLSFQETPRVKSNIDRYDK